jgi:uncharacterized protein (DUF1330 family)
MARMPVADGAQGPDYEEHFETGVQQHGGQEIHRGHLTLAFDGRAARLGEAS